MKQLAFVASLAVFFAAFIASPLIANKPLAYVLSMVAAAGMVAVIGARVGKRPLGVLISERNLMSLTRFQTVLWTVIVISAFSTIIFGRLYAGASLDTILKDAIRPDLLALMGISYVSAVGSSMVLQNKQTKNVTGATVAQAQQNVDDPTAGNVGVLFKNAAVKDAAITDMFEGDELADTNLIDISKVQMFFFTIVSAAVFIGMMFGQLADVAKALIPTLPESLIALMGISHVAYVGNKTVTRTPEAPAGATVPQAGAGAGVGAGAANIVNPALPAGGAVVKQ